MKKYTLFLIMLFVAQAIFALPRTPEKARKIALQFIENTAEMQLAKGRRLTRSIGNNVPSQVVSEPYYVFNAADDAGFVIVSGDDQFREVLGYADEGRINLDNLPPAARYWLNCLEAEMEAALDNPQVLVREDKQEEATENVYAVEPLISTRWNQGAPYNNLCPMDGSSRSVTGCVATAMAQVMNFWEYPAVGVGSSSYSVLGKTLSANYASTHYDWDNMLNVYSSTATEEEKKAVALLMYHCGVSLEMDYSSEASGTPQAYIGRALINYFSYNENMSMVGRDYYSLAKWESMIKGELNAGRPVMYNGRSSGGGHSFLCDGYNASNLFHFNWGWGGYADGYYALTALAPGSGGTGSGAGTYNENQHIFLNAQPEELGTFASRFEITNDYTFSKTSFSRTSSLTISCSEGLWCYTIPSFSGKVGIGLWQNGEFVSFLTEPRHMNLSAGHGYKSSSFTGYIPSDLQNGTYQIFLASKDNREDTPQRFAAPADKLPYRLLTIEGNQCTITNPEIGPELVQVDIAPLTSPVCHTKDATFKITVRNDGTGFEGGIGVKIRKMGSLTNQRIKGSTVTIAGGEQKEITVSGNITLEEGEYGLYLYYQKGSIWKTYSDNPQTIYICNADGVEHTDEELFSVYAANKSLVVKTADMNSPIEVYDMQGTKISTQLPVQNRTIISVPHTGMYIVSQDKNTQKVILH